jgi:hypothetical protein
MNTRGLVELIVLNIGYDLKVIPPTLFAMLVIMALVTTFATTPILHFITGKEEFSGGEEISEPAAKLRLVHPVRQGILVPVSNPEKVASLLEIALCATTSEDAPPRVAAFVRRPGGGIRSGLREAEHRVVPRSAALSAALDYALDRHAAIIPQAAWSEAPARDIIQLASAIHADWILLGFHRPVFGADFRGGTVGEVLKEIVSLPINVGIVVNQILNPIDRVCTIIDPSAHGWASLDLATHISRQRNCPIEVIWAANHGNDEEFQSMLTAASRRTSQAIQRMNIADWQNHALGDFVIVGTNLVDRQPFATRLIQSQRCLIVVQGSSIRTPVEAHLAERAAVAP